jgi:hypothetical protein
LGGRECVEEVFRDVEADLWSGIRSWGEIGVFVEEAEIVWEQDSRSSSQDVGCFCCDIKDLLDIVADRCVCACMATNG